MTFPGIGFIVFQFIGADTTNIPLRVRAALLSPTSSDRRGRTTELGTIDFLSRFNTGEDHFKWIKPERISLESNIK